MDKPVPIYRVPIRDRILRCIKTGECFNALNQQLATALRWENGFWILSVRVYRNTKDKYSMPVDLDIAVGRKNEYPFLIRSPYTDDPRANKIYVPHWPKNWWSKPGSHEPVMHEAELDVKYNHYAEVTDMTMIRRLDMLHAVTIMQKRGVDEFINPETGRKNKARKNVRHLFCYMCEEGMALNIDSPWVAHAKDMWSPDPNKKYHWIRNPKYNFQVVPMIEYGWYFATSGKLAFKSADPEFKPELFNPELYS